MDQLKAVTTISTYKDDDGKEMRGREGIYCGGCRLAAETDGWEGSNCFLLPSLDGEIFCPYFRGMTVSVDGEIIVSCDWDGFVD